ncbi:MAG: hypothetical protein V3V08_01550 [Nannocystaceae bacterium]
MKFGIIWCMIGALLGGGVVLTMRKFASPRPGAPSLREALAVLLSSTCPLSIEVLGRIERGAENWSGIFPVAVQEPSSSDLARKACSLFLERLGPGRLSSILPIEVACRWLAADASAFFRDEGIAWFPAYVTNGRVVQHGDLADYGLFDKTPNERAIGDN